VPGKLTLYPSEGVSRHFVLREEVENTVGRDPECDVVLEDPRVSTRHALLRSSRGDWRLRDLQSKNGTFVNAIRVTEAALADADWVSLGGLLSRFELVSSEQVEALRTERTRRLQTFSEARRILGEKKEPDALLRTLLSSMLDLTGAERGLLLVFAPGGQVRAEVVAGFAAGAPHARGFDGSFGAIEKVLQTGRPVVTSSAVADAFLGKRRSVLEMGIEALACVPLKSEGRPIGLLYVDGSKRGGAFTDLDLEILEALAEHATLVAGTLNLDRQIRELVGAPAGSVRESGPGFLEELERRVGEIAGRLSEAPTAP
jgi:transcriptional regulator with GAF, ATPase, and Fis domain